MFFFIKMKFIKTLILFMAILCLAFLISGCNLSEQKINITTEYKAIFLDNGQVFFGQLEKAGASYTVIKDIFYVQRQVVEKDSDNKEVKNILIKRGSEWHGPDVMYINNRHIVVIEPVSSGSRVAQLIKEAKVQKPGGAQ